MQILLLFSKKGTMQNQKQVSRQTNETKKEAQGTSYLMDAEMLKGRYVKL